MEIAGTYPSTKVIEAPEAIKEIRVDMVAEDVENVVVVMVAARAAGRAAAPVGCLTRTVKGVMQVHLQLQQDHLVLSKQQPAQLILEQFGTATQLPFALVQVAWPTQLLSVLPEAPMLTLETPMLPLLLANLPAFS